MNMMIFPNAVKCMALSVTACLMTALRPSAAVPDRESGVRHGEYDIVVAKDGSGDCLTVQDAIDAVPYYSKEETTIYIRPGTYREKVTVPANRQKIRMVGDDALTTVITWDDYALKPDFHGNPMGTSATSTVFIYGDDFLAENITFENSAGEGREIAQACAITVDADRAAFLGCRFIANQDTIYTYGKGQHQYLLDRGNDRFHFRCFHCLVRELYHTEQEGQLCHCGIDPRG